MNNSDAQNVRTAPGPVGIGGVLFLLIIFLIIIHQIAILGFGMAAILIHSSKKNEIKAGILAIIATIIVIAFIAYSVFVDMNYLMNTALVAISTAVLVGLYFSIYTYLDRHAAFYGPVSQAVIHTAPATETRVGFAGSGYQGDDFGFDGTQAAMSGGRRTMGGDKHHAADDHDFAFDDSVFDRPEPRPRYQPPAPSKAAQNLIPLVRKYQERGVERFSDGLDAMAKTTATEMVKEAINDPTISSEDRAFLRRILSYREDVAKRTLGNEERRMITGH